MPTPLFGVTHLSCWTPSLLALLRHGHGRRGTLHANTRGTGTFNHCTTIGHAGTPAELLTRSKDDDHDGGVSRGSGYPPAPDLDS